MVQMLLLILAIFIFKECLDTAGVVKQMSSVATGSLALYAAAMLLPFLVGVISGITIGFVGPTFPLLLAMLAGAGVTNVLPWGDARVGFGLCRCHDFAHTRMFYPDLPVFPGARISGMAQACGPRLWL